MNGCDWILCENSQRWAAAIRHSLRRRPADCEPRRILETRTIDEMLSRLDMQPDSLVLIEVTPANFLNILDVVAHAVPRFPLAHFAVLLDGQLLPSREAGQRSPSSNSHETLDALAEAGASAFATSPRKLRGIFDVAGKHADCLREQTSPPADLPLAAWAMSLLPWQDA